MLIGKNKRKVGKKALCLIFAFLLSINSFAAIVSDNDGAAFVTKAEFDALKSNFASQVDQYNTSIDSKIDGAIASYLAGINITRQPDNLWIKVMVSSANKFRWCSGPLPSSTNRGTADTDLKDNITITGLRYHNHPEWNVYGTVRSHGTKGTHDSPGVIYAVSWASAAATSYAVDPPQHIERAYTGGAGTNLTDLTAWTDQYSWTRKDSYATNANLNNSWVTTKSESEGNGKLYELNRLPNDNFELKSYYTKAYVDDQINIKSYTYKSFRTPTNITQFNNFYTVAHGMDLTSRIDVNYDKGTGWNGYTVGSSADVDYNKTSNWNYATQELAWIKESDGKDYSYMYWGTNVNQTLYAITDNVKPDWNSATEYTGFCNGTTASTYYTYQRDFYEYTGPNNEDVRIGNIKYKFYHPVVTPVAYTLKQIQNSYASKIASEEVYHGNGAPLFYLYDKDATYKLNNISIELYNSNGNLTSGDVKIMVSNNKFVDGNYANTTNDKCWETTVSVGSTGRLTFNSDSFNVGNVDTVWINIYPTDTSSFKMVKLVSVDPVVSS